MNDLEIPGKREELAGWAQEVIQQCEGSRQQRIDQYAGWRQLYFTGSITGEPSPYNKLFPHIDTLGSYLYSPRAVRLLIEYDSSDDQGARDRGRVASNYMSRVFARRRFNFACESANTWSLVKGACVIKTLWGNGGCTPNVIQPEFMAVWREDVNELDDQEAFVHTMFITEGQFERMLVGHPRREQLLDEVHFSSDQEIDPMRESIFKDIVIGQNQPISTGPPSGNMIGNVNIQSAYFPILPPQLAKRLVRLDELWVQDQKRQDWTTIQIANKRAVVEGDVTHRNLCGVKGKQPFTLFCANYIDGYIWGMSELSPLMGLQLGLNAGITNIDRIELLQAKPPISAIGIPGFTQQIRDQLMAPDGFMSEAEQGGKLENMAPKLPDGAYQNLNNRIDWLNDVSGITSTLRGENQPGVRAGGHAETLVRTSSPRLIDRALKVEEDVAELGDFMLRLEQTKSTRPFKYGKPGKDGVQPSFLLKDLPSDFVMTVDSHSASPAFSEEGKTLAFGLLRAGAIDAVDLIRLTHPPQEDSLIAAAEQRARDRAEFLAKNPDVAKKQAAKMRNKA